MNNYVIRYHDFFRKRLTLLMDQAERLQSLLPKEDYVKHEVVKLLERISRATKETIPQDPNNISYKLRGTLSKFRRFKQGIRRYRLIFCFSKNPPLILYCYINDKEHLRKDGDKNDPYGEFCNLLNTGMFSHNPHDPKIQKWVRAEL
jgi:mRNA-degrading endonuclease RelE of RelBE toxin-antitoxin system